MNKVQVLDSGGKKVKEITAPKDIFSVPMNDHLLYEAVINYRANQRRGAASTKTRAMIRGGGRKPWRQKGTGRARAGSIRSPLWRSGGVTFGPRPRDYSYRIPKKARRKALRSALAAKLAEKQLIVVETLDFKQPKTKEGIKLLDNLNFKSALIVDSHENKNLMLSVRNIPKVKAVDYNYLNVYDVLNHKGLIFSQRAFDSLMEKLK
jgi:large subunit ribosomal protein L4